MEELLMEKPRTTIEMLLQAIKDGAIHIVDLLKKKNTNISDNGRKVSVTRS